MVSSYHQVGCCTNPLAYFFANFPAFFLVPLTAPQWCREVDMFIEKLEKTLSFFRSLENQGKASPDDDFVPFI
jgi:hypothetical protein